MAEQYINNNGKANEEGEQFNLNINNTIAGKNLNTHESCFSLLLSLIKKESCWFFCWLIILIFWITCAIWSIITM